ncbi:MAG: RNA polymerase sigma factor [Phycisphaerales bacterium]
MADSLWQDKTLIWRFNRGDPQALRGIYARYRVDLVTLATSLLFDKSQAEDVVHEVFARLAQNGTAIRITSNLRGYLLRAVANTARNANRSRRGKDVSQADANGDGLRVNPPPDGRIADAELCERLPAALEQLPYEQREAVLLRHYGGMRFKAIAACQSVSVSTVQARYRYGLDKLRSLLGGDP